MKNQLPISEFFETRLGAKMHDRYAWGAIRTPDNAIILRLWQHEITKGEDGTYRALVQMSADNASHSSSYPSKKERVAHVTRMMEDQAAFGVVSIVKDPSNPNAGAKSYDSTRLMVLGTPYVGPDNNVYAPITGVQYL